LGLERQKRYRKLAVAFVPRIEKPLVELVVNKGRPRRLCGTVAVRGGTAGLAPDPLPPAVDSHQTAFRDAVPAGQNVEGDLVLDLPDQKDPLLQEHSGMTAAAG